MLALATGGALGLGVGLLPRLRINVLASIDVLRTVPAVSLMPIALLALGPAPVTELLLATWAAQWAVVVNISGGVRGIPERYYDVARMLRLTRAGILRTVVVPAVVPAAMVGMRLAVIVALHVTITAEMVMAPAGLGGAMVRAMQTLDVDRLWAYARGVRRSRRRGQQRAAAAGRGRRCPVARPTTGSSDEAVGPAAPRCRNPGARSAPAGRRPGGVADRRRPPLGGRAAAERVAGRAGKAHRRG